MWSSLSSLCFLLPQFFYLLSPQFTGKSSRNSKVLRTAIARAQRGMMPGHLAVGPNAVQTTQLKQWGRKACIFYWPISNHLLCCPSQQGKLGHAELCATVGEIFLMNQGYVRYVYTAPQYIPYLYIYICICIYTGRITLLPRPIATVKRVQSLAFLYSVLVLYFLNSSVISSEAA